MPTRWWLRRWPFGDRVGWLSCQCDQILQKKSKMCHLDCLPQIFFCFFFQELENWATGGNQFFPRIFFKRVIFLIFRLKVFYSNGHYLKTCKKSKFHENSIRSEKKVSSRNDQTWLNKNGCKASLASPPGGENENECWNTLASSNLCNIYTFKIVFIVRESKLRSF